MNRISFDQIPEGLLLSMRSLEEYLKTNIIESGVLDKGFMELIRFRVSQINQCAFCIDMHYKEAIAAGESELRLYSAPVWQDVSYFTDVEETILAWTESVTRLSDTTKQTQVTFLALQKQLNQADIANLTLAITQINAWNRLAKAFGFEAGHYQVGQFE